MTYDFMKNMVSEKEVWNALKEVKDMELGIDVVNLGLIYKVEVNEGKDVYILMTLTTPGCPLANAIVADVYDKIKSLPGVENVDIDLTFDPPWTPDRLSDEAKRLLGFSSGSESDSVDNTHDGSGDLK